jgi:hypothetical protein
MQKPKPQSKQAPFCTTFLHEIFLASNTIRTFLKQLFWWKPTWTRDQNTPWYKDEDLNKNQGEKWKLNTVLEKENTCWTIRVKNRVFLANEKQGNFSKRNLLRSNHLLQKTKLKKLKTKDKTLQEKHIVHEAIKI